MYLEDPWPATMWIFIGGEYLLERFTAPEIFLAGRSCYGRRSNGSHTVAPGLVLPSRQTREWPSGAAGRPGVSDVTQSGSGDPTMTHGHLEPMTPGGRCALAQITLASWWPSPP
jgi:hypothetical protein